MTRLWVAFCFVVLMTGCSAELVNGLLLPARPSADVIQHLAELPKPTGLKGGGDLEILLVRAGGELTIYNRSARVYRNCQLWLNGEYVAEIKELKQGELSVNLRGFINEHGESFPVGHFLTPNLAYPVVLGEVVLQWRGERVKHLVEVRIGDDIDRIGT